MRMLPLLVVFAVLAAGIGYALAAKGQPFLRCDSPPLVPQNRPPRPRVAVGNPALAERGWPAARTVLATRPDPTRSGPDGTRTLVMATSGPDFAACSESHRVATGHPAEGRVGDLLGAGGP